MKQTRNARLDALTRLHSGYHGRAHARCDQCKEYTSRYDFLQARLKSSITLSSLLAKKWPDQGLTRLLLRQDNRTDLAVTVIGNRLIVQFQTDKMQSLLSSRGETPCHEPAYDFPWIPVSSQQENGLVTPMDEQPP